MKKLLALVLAGVMVMGLSVTAMAAPTEFSNLINLEGHTLHADKEIPFDDSAEVKVIVGTTAVDPVYYVTVDWESLDFTYNFNNGNAQWNPLDHTYKATDKPSGWVKTSSNVTVTNHSNKAVDVVAGFVDGTDLTAQSKTVNNVTATLKYGTANTVAFTLATGVGKTFDTAAKDTFSVNVSGIPSIESGFSIGNVGVRISAIATNN